ncbi:MAG: GNAT family N-acetyltransferase, partial [Gemmataceae bacterium]|nr:GNAT family N-acetyltransferase [Gemmataceae bacterium]
FTHAQFTVDLIRAALARGRELTPVRATPRAEPQVRELQPSDRAQVENIASQCGICRPEEGVPGTVANGDRLANGPPNEHHGVVVEWADQVVGFAEIGKLRQTGNTYGLHRIAVAPSAQGQGLGVCLLREVEAQMVALGGRLLVAETSSRACQAPARHFFLRQGFRLVGNVPDFYREGESRLTYVKYLRTED